VAPRTRTTTSPEVAAALVELLAEAQAIGAIGPAPLARHIDHAAAFLDAVGTLPDRPRLLDLGSGGGLPGLVLADLLPQASCTLLDGRTERTRLLSDFVDRLGWQDRVEVVAARAEEAGRGPLRGTFDLVVARGFARPAPTAECAAPFLRPSGRLVVSEPPAGSLGSADRWPAEPCAELGLRPLAVPQLSWAFVVLLQEHRCPERFPRRIGVPAKRPLF
jgi:16S rRNA (guanine527-N7)-methyltransferase